MLATPSLPRDLANALVAVGDLMADARGEWWIVAGAAVALHGVADVTVGDVDVLLTPRDVPLIAMLPGLGMRDTAGHMRFRSDFYASIDRCGMTVEFMAGFHVRGAEGWTAVCPVSRIPVVVDGATLFIPDRADLAAMLCRFGRPKDIERAALLTG